MTERNHSIAIVDDDELLRRVYVEVFRNAGFDVYEGKDGNEGLELLKKHDPEVLFTGIMMPNLSGWELLEKMRADPEIAAIPVVVSSHLGRDEDKKKALELGAKAFVIKGKITPKNLVELILGLLEQKFFRVIVDPEKLDAPQLMKQLNASEPLLLEIRSTGEGTFSAQIVKKKNDSKDLEALETLE